MHDAIRLDTDLLRESPLLATAVSQFLTFTHNPGLGAMFSALKKAARATLEARGFYLHRRDVLPYGIDFIVDIKRLMPDVRCFFDVGAYHGAVSKQALAEFPNANVIAFDPTPECFRLLTRLSSERFRVYNLALSDRIETHPLFFNEGDGSRNSLLFSDASVQSIQVNCTTLDAFCQQHNIQRVDVLKIDTEGADMAVLRGASNTIVQRGVRFVYSEFFNDGNGTTLKQLIEFLEPLGFRFIATSTDNIFPHDEDIFVSANALFFRYRFPYP